MAAIDFALPYFGTKKACEPVHVQYSYDDRSIVIVNGTDRRVAGKVSVKVLNTDLAERFSREIDIDVAPDTSSRVLTVPQLSDVSPTHFLVLRLLSRAGQAVSQNLYWLSTKAEELDWAKSTWFTTPVTSYADFTALNDLPPATLATTMTTKRRGDEHHFRVTVRNPGKTLAFFVREAFPSRATATSLTDGMIGTGMELCIVSEMNERGVVFGDGIEDDCLDFGWGMRISVGIAVTRLNLVVG